MVDEWRLSGITEVQLRELGYSDDDSTRLARHLDDDTPLVMMPATDRKRIEAFRHKLGEACVGRLTTMPPDDLDNTLQEHGFTSKDRVLLVTALTQ